MNEKQLTVSGIVIALGFMVALGSYYIITPGEIAIHTRTGRIVSTNSNPGLYFKIPIVDGVSKIPSTIQKFSITTEALSHDLQFVEMEVAINFKITDAIKLYMEIGEGDNLYHRIIEPTTQETMKAVVAQYTAEELIQKRNEVNAKVSADLRLRLNEYPIMLIDFNFVHLDFHQDFITAVENKQIALQSAMTAKNLTEKIKEEALQTRERADAEAYAMKVKQLTVTPDIISLKAIEKWDGRLPQTMTGAALPFLPIGN